MKICIVGFGRMGRRIRELALLSGYEVVSIIDPYSQELLVTSNQLSVESLNGADVIIDFSTPSAAYSNIKFYIENSLKAVIGTTGWYEKLDEVKRLIGESKASILYSGNFSLGVAALLKVVSYAAKIMNNLPSYDASVHEIHHREKADSPSGTGLMIAREIVKALDRKTRIVDEKQSEKIDHAALHLSSARFGYVPGIHSVYFDSLEDTIEITHTARSRDGFASGSLRAASYLYEKNSTGLFSMDDFISELLGG